MFLTGNKDVDREILFKLPYYDEFIVFYNTEYGRCLCNETFFENALRIYFPRSLEECAYSVIKKADIYLFNLKVKRALFQLFRFEYKPDYNFTAQYYFHELCVYKTKYLEEIKSSDFSLNKKFIKKGLELCIARNRFDLHILRYLLVENEADYDMFYSTLLTILRNYFIKDDLTKFNSSEQKKVFEIIRWLTQLEKFQIQDYEPIFKIINSKIDKDIFYYNMFNYFANIVPTNK